MRSGSESQREESGRKEWGMEAILPTMGGDRSNKLKEGQTEEEGIHATRVGFGAGLEDSQHL